MIELTVIALLWFGGSFVLIAAIGIVRFPDVFMRMHAATKAGTLGIASLALAVAVHASSVSVAFEAILISLFFLLTAPIATHVIGRAAYRGGTPIWARTICDEFGKTASEIREETERQASEAAQADGDRPE